MKNSKIEIKLNYGNSIVALPSTILSYIDKAKKFDLKVLFLLADSEKYRNGKYISNIAKELSAEEHDVENSIAFWNGTGIISLSGNDSIKVEDKPVLKEENKAPKRVKVTELPQYTSAELNELLKHHNQIVGLVDECQNILGKIFTASDIKVLMGLVDYLGLDNDYILVLMHYAARKEMKSMRYIEKIAVSCLDDGYTDAAVLQNALCAREEKEAFEYKVKNIFGAGDRKLSSKEKKCVDAWITTYQFAIEIIEKAYDITISATNKPSIPYAHAILERWHNEGLKNIDDINAALDKRELEKGGEGSSFDIDEFFNAALDRSYADKK